MSQTVFGSFVESWANIVVEFAINWTANMLVLPLFGFNLSGSTAFELGLVYTIISLGRSFVLRRVFDKMSWGHTDEGK